MLPSSSPSSHGRPLTADPAVLAAMRALALGRLGEATSDPQLRAVAPLVADVVAADAAARMAEIACTELRDLDARVAHEAPDDPLLRWWVVAILGERAFLDADLGAIPLAVQALAEMPTDAFAPTPIMYVRARLRRLAAALYLADPSPENVARHRELRDQAVADFLRCDFTAEAAITRGLAAAIRAILTWDDMLENLAVVQDERRALEDLEGSIWVPLLDQLAVLVAVNVGDLDAATEATAALEHHRGEHRVFNAFAAFGRALVEVAASEGDDEAVGNLTGALDWLKRTHPQFLAQTQIQAANVCADFGVAAAREFGRAGLDWPPLSPALALRGQLLEIRLDLLDGSRPPVADGLDLLGRLAGMGPARQAGAIALRIARDYDRAGSPADAAELRRWAEARLPDPTRRTAWETRWASPAMPTRPLPVAAPGHDDREDQATLPTGSPARRATDRVPVSVRVLAPTLEVELAGTPIELRDKPAKLLLTLLLAHPAPVHVERAADVLWPDADVASGRRRLNTVVYRLRQTLELDVRALQRSGDVLILDPAAWDVDIVHFHADIRAGGDRSVAALRLVRGNLCHVQFPYDEHFLDERRAVAAEAARAIGKLDPSARGTPSELDEILRRLDPDGSLVTS